MRGSVSLESKESTPEVEGKGEQQISRVDAEGSKSGNQSQKSRKSDYELTREVNIAKNIELIKEIGKKYRLPDDLKPRPEKKANKTKGRKKEKDGPSRTSARLAGGAK
jgi:hypothetical protein